MLSRIFWVGIAGIALVTGMILQDGDRMFSWGHDVDRQVDRSVDTDVDRVVDTVKDNVDRAIDGSFDQMQVTDGEGNEIAVPAETKRALGAAVGNLVKAEADLAILKVRDGSAEEMRAANARRAEARAEVDRLKAEIKGEGPAARAEQDALAAQIERDVRDDVRTQIREEIRDAVRN